MKLRSFIFGAVAAIVALVSCDQKESGQENLGAPTITLDQTTMTFGSEADSKSLSLMATRNWQVTGGADWIEVSPKSGTGSADPQTVTVAVSANAGENVYDREATLTFTIGMASQTLKVTQEGAKGSLESLVLYKNLFDAEEATKTYGSQGSSWPYLDQFPQGWNAPEGTGLEGVDYTYSGMSLRANQDSFTYAEEGFEGSGVNNLFFASNAYFVITNIDLGGAKNVSISFAGQKNENNSAEKPFMESEFHVWVSLDATNWLEVDYTYNGTQATKWNTASAVVTLPDNAEKLSFAFTADVASVYRIDDLVISSALEAGTPLDFSAAEEKDFGVVTPPSTAIIEDVTVAEFNAKPVSTSNWYRLTGKVGTGDINTEYGNFDLVDATGSVYVYGISNWSDFKDNFKAGDNVVVVGQRYDYNGKIEVKEGYIESYSAGDGTVPDSPTPDTPAVEQPSTLTPLTVAQFLTKEVNTTDWYQLTGTIISIEKETYGNFTIEDETGTVYVYGMTNGWVGNNNQSFASIGLKVGDIVTFGTLRAEYNGNPQAGGSVYPAYYISHEVGVVEVHVGVELNFPSGNQKSVNSYSDSFDVVMNNCTWALTSFNNNNNGWAYVKCGHKNTAYVATIATKTPIAAKVTKVTVTIDKLLKSSYVNSASLVVASDANFTNVLETVNVTIKAGNLDYVIATPVANAYYKLVYDCAAGDGNTNGNIQISKVFYQTEE